MPLPRKTGGWGAILYSLKMARLAGGIWPMMRALISRNNCKSCALGMGGQNPNPSVQAADPMGNPCQRTSRWTESLLAFTALLVAASG